MFCGIYLSLVWAANFYYGEGYAVKEQKWESSPVCFVGFTLVLFFNLWSPPLLFILSLSRLMVILYPFHSVFQI